MSVQISDLVSYVRNLIEDNSELQTDLETYENSAIFTLTESKVISVSEVRVNSISSGVSYTYDSSTNKVTITSSLSAGDTVEIDYTCYLNYSDTEIQKYLESSLLHIAVRNYKDFEVVGTNDIIVPEPIKREKYLIALIASILINKPMKTVRLPDISINYAENLSVDDKISRTLIIFKSNSHGMFSIL